MVCQNCGCQDRVVRTFTEGDHVRRERRCPMCGFITNTREEIVSMSAPKPKTKKKKPAPKKENPPEPKQEPADSPKGALAKALASAK